MNVLLLSGYWPVVGKSLAVAGAGERLTLIVPEDEAVLAHRGWADEVVTFRPGSLNDINSAGEALRRPLQALGKTFQWENSHIGMEKGDATVPSSYAAMNIYGNLLRRLVSEMFPSASLEPADLVLAELRSLKTSHEQARIRAACGIAEAAFTAGANQWHPGLTELEAANLFRAPLSAALTMAPEIARADGFVSCMSGPNSALAGAAYARSTTRRIEAGDLVLVHCNSYADGYWTDITRTFSMGQPDARSASMRDAVFAARDAAIGALTPGAKASSVDLAARTVLRERGFGDGFTHPTGHGVGFAAIDGDAHPRLHPVSTDTLQEGMTFNVEPAIYVGGLGGIRHCDMFALTESGPQLLTPFFCDPSGLVLSD